jgi:hypothetical protein
MKTFSIIHASARPDGPLCWKNAYENWMSNASHPEEIEYLLCVDVGGPFGAPPYPHISQVVLPYDNVRLVWNTGRKCIVDASNAGAKASTGKILILNSDDMVAPPGWDADLLSVSPDLDTEFVVSVPVSPSGVLTLQIFSRKRYSRLGYAFYPEYLSAYADNEFTDHAIRDRVTVNGMNIQFKHNHPGWNGPGWDEVYAHENSAKAYELGRALFAQRQEANFPPYTGDKVA